MRKSVIVCALCVWSMIVSAAFEHVVFDSVELNGEWEMAYRPYTMLRYERAYPRFSGVPVRKAVPGYWEDMVSDFRSAGITDDFRINPLHVEQKFPIAGYASDTTLPDIYGTFLYRRRVTLERAGAAVLAFEGVRNQVHVWINGEFTAFRAGFSTPFELEVPAGILRKGDNEIVLAVSNGPNPGYNGGWVVGLATRSLFFSTGGVTGKLELRFPRSALADVYVTTAPDCKSFTVHAAGAKDFKYVILDGSRVCARGRAGGDFTLSADGFEFWSPENPKRYTLEIAVPEGVYRQKFGIRRLTARGEKLFLNGQPVYLRGITEHCYYAETVHLPRDLDYYRRITRRRKELGFNFLRFHTFVPPVEYLEAMDELGMLVHIESPNFVPEREYEAIVAFARRHPCTVIYCTGNETRIDRVAEAYLKNIADIVHSGTDSLFSPMSALRGIEYALMEKADNVVAKPFRHNAERAARVAEFSDLFTSYQRALVSYSSLNEGDAQTLDSWGDAYCGKPRTSHEICIDGSYIDLGLEKLYPENSPILKTGLFSGVRRHLAERGLLDRADAYFRNSCEWMWRIRKHCFEKLRASDRTAGYDFLGDINTHWHTFGYSVGMMDEFFRLKPGETVAGVLRYNSAAVVLCDLGSDFNVRAGEVKNVNFSISNYEGTAPDAVLRVDLVDAGSGRTVHSETRAVGEVSNGKLVQLGAFAVTLPASDSVRKYLLRSAFSGGKVTAENEWELHAFPAPAAAGVSIARIVDDITKEDLLAAMSRGERLLLLGSGPFKSLPTTYRIGLAGRCSGNYATVIEKGHPALEGLPHDGWCDWQFRRLMEGGRAVQLEAGVPFAPIIDIASSEKNAIRQAALFEYRVGEGRLLVCSFNFKGADPAQAWLKVRLAEYVSGSSFSPKQALTLRELDAVITAPLINASENVNRAQNVNDFSSLVRAGEDAFP